MKPLTAVVPLAAVAALAIAAPASAVVSGDEAVRKATDRLQDHTYTVERRDDYTGDVRYWIARLCTGGDAFVESGTRGVTDPDLFTSRWRVLSARFHSRRGSATVKMRTRFRQNYPVEFRFTGHGIEIDGVKAEVERAPGC
jgi:hypothetical protein